MLNDSGSFTPRKFLTRIVFQPCKSNHDISLNSYILFPWCQKLMCHGKMAYSYAVQSWGWKIKHILFLQLSGILLLTNPGCPPLHSVCSDKFACQAIYSLSECCVDKVLGHSESPGELISTEFSPN